MNPESIFTVERWDDQTHRVMSFHYSRVAAVEWMRAYTALHQALHGSLYGCDYEVEEHRIASKDESTTFMAKKAAYLSAKKVLVDTEKGGCRVL